MPVQTPEITINPYQSTVPVVQIPPEQFGNTTPAQPLQGAFKKGTGALAIGDSILKGFLAGHQYKEQKKQAQAQATIAAADSATNAAWQKYQDALGAASGNTKDPKAQAAYQAYVGIFNQAKTAKSQFVIPQKPEKGDKSKKKEKGPGFFNNIKEFMEANPHIVPQLALMSMQPNPEGMTPETRSTAATQEAQAAETGYYQQLNQQAKLKTDAEQAVAQYGGLTDAEWSAMSPAAREAGQKTLRNARAYLDSASGKQKYLTLVGPNGEQQMVPEGTEIPVGWHVYEKPTGATKLYQKKDGTLAWLHPDSEDAQNAEPIQTTGEAKPGTLGFYVQQYAKENSIPIDQLTTKDLDYINQWQAYDRTRGSLTGTTTRQGLDATTSARSIGAPPQPPEGRRGIAAVPQGGMTPPPVPAAKTQALASASPTAKTRSGGMTAPPNRQANPSMNRVRITEQTNTQKQNMYTKAKAQFDKNMLNNAKAYAGDPEGKTKADQMVQAQYNLDALSIENWYRQQVVATGGSVPKRHVAQDKDGNLYTTLDGQYWFNEKTGMPYQP